MSLQRFIESHRRLFVLSGAGCSTASGIPDYRDSAGNWKRSPPMTYQAFTGAALARRRYWARSMAGWPTIASAQPNEAHRALARLESTGHVSTLVTQNVDGLHQRAGSGNVIDLHGRLDTVACLGCSQRTTRSAFQQAVTAKNPTWAAGTVAVAPDGDADIDEADFSDFQVPACASCGGILKPDVVFFGEAVPRSRVSQAMAALGQADAVLIVGSSLMVFSGYRFARQAAQLGLPIASVTQGIGRADDLLSLKVDARCDRALSFALDYAK